MSTEAKTCGECRFDAGAWNAHDAERTVASFLLRWEWTTEGRLEPPPLPGSTGTDAVHEVTHRLHEAGRQVHAAGHGAPTQRGSVHQLNVSGGGVPKTPVERASIGYRGRRGDRQAARRHHGRVWQAVSLWSVEVIERLRAEGHPVAPGLAGENITVAGVDWATLRPGVQVQVGTALLELSAYAAPCKKNAAWFLEGEFNRMAHEREPGVSRLYASVLRDGEVAAGDQVIVEP